MSLSTNSSWGDSLSTVARSLMWCALCLGVIPSKAEEISLELDQVKIGAAQTSGIVRMTYPDGHREAIPFAGFAVDSDHIYVTGLETTRLPGFELLANVQTETGGSMCGDGSTFQLCGSESGAGTQGAPIVFGVIGACLVGVGANMGACALACAGRGISSVSHGDCGINGSCSCNPPPPQSPPAGGGSSPTPSPAPGDCNDPDSEEGDDMPCTVDDFPPVYMKPWIISPAAG